jgi:type I restriction enzyme R subunit
VIFKHELAADKKIDFKVKVKSFLRTYSYLAKILDFNNQGWEKLWWFLKNLLPKLVLEDIPDLAEGVLEAIDMDSYRPAKQATQDILLEDTEGVVEPIPVELKGGKPEPEMDTLENILNAFNQRFGDIEWTDKDKVKSLPNNFQPK